MFTRLEYYGTVQMHMSEDRFWSMPLGKFLDFWAAHKQFIGAEKPLQDDTDYVLGLFG